MTKTKFKKGAASFYVVAFSTLILLIIVASFTALVVAQITRSSNADLSQSAYDSALAGVEDAKLAFYSYQNCLAQGPVEGKQPEEGEEFGCPQIVWTMENDSSCDMVAKILGRSEGGVSIDESASGNNMSQSYTCVKIQKDLKDYRATLSADNQMKVIKPSFADGIHANEITEVRISWGMPQAESRAFSFSTFNPTFPSANPLSGVLDPPIISVALLQARENFSLSSFDMVQDNRTNRGMVYLIPTNSESITPDSRYEFAKAENNTIQAANLVKSNDRTSKNLPFAVLCNQDLDTAFPCTVTMELPKPIDGERTDDNFVIAVALPYGKPVTNFSVEFFAGNASGGGTSEEGTQAAVLEGMQIGVDSTGRANDLFRRVETRLEEKDDSLLSIMGPLELFGNGDNGGNGGTGENDSALEKNLKVTCEWIFADSNTLPGCRGL